MGTLRTTITRRTLFDGTSKLYPNIATYQRITDRDVINYMVSNSGIKKNVAIATVAALRQVITNYLLNGHTVKFPYLGTFRLSANTKGVDTIEKANASCIKSLKICFTPTVETKQACKSVKFKSLLGDSVKMAEPEKKA